MSSKPDKTPTKKSLKNDKSYEVRNQVLSHMPENQKKDIEDLFNIVGKNKEFEFIFFSKKGHHMNKEKYVLFLKYMKNMSKLKKVVRSDKVLDINYNIGDNTYRISVHGTDEINKIGNRLNDIQNKNYIIYKFLLHVMNREKNKNISFMKKIKSEANTIDIEDLNIRARLSTELDLTKDTKGIEIDKILEKILEGETLDLETRKHLNDNISFRLKERITMFVEETDEYSIRVDLTDTKYSKDFKKLETSFSTYELEIEYGADNNKNVLPEHLNTIYSTAETLLKLVQQSTFILGNIQSQKVLAFYREMTGADENMNNLLSRQPVSIEIQHATGELPDKYAVSDKADGDRYFLIIFNNSVYLLSNNLSVKDTGIILDKSLDKYNGTIMDGEYIYIPAEKRHLFMVFDCLRTGSQDIRSVSSFMSRLEHADKIIDDCFVLKDQVGFKYKKPDIVSSKEFDIDAMTKFYGTELARFYNVLNTDAKQSKLYPLIRRKYFMQVFGAKPWEIFKYSVEYWSRYTEDASVKAPYLLDGLIYHPLEQSYATSSADSKYAEYKWKPPQNNTIDFYIEFKRDPQTKQIQIVYDNSNATDDMEKEGTVRNKPYKICKLHVGKSLNNKEFPVPFEENYGISDAYIFLKDGDVRDTSGELISDKTVVEFYYQNDPNIAPQHRWIPIKIRYEKTESVERFGRRYGNNQRVAERIWRAIVNPVLMQDLIELAKGNTDNRNFYDIKKKEMNSKISHELIIAINKEKKYYQKVSKIAETMRDYHNWIKSNLIYTYCNKMYQSNVQQSVLDIGFGRGGDIAKYYYTGVAFLVGIDVDAEGFKSPDDGAISRYNRFRQKKPNFPKMYFIQADARGLLNYESQAKLFNNMDDMNRKMLQKFFPSSGSSEKPTLFDRIDCQFAMHYFLKDDMSWSNFKQNLKTHLRNGGYFIATTFDAKCVIDAIGKNETFTVHYDDKEGNKKVFFDIVKKYEIKQGEKIGTGHAIDLYDSWMFNEGNYFTEYLVDINFITEELERDADLELVDTDLFVNQYEIHRGFLTDAAKYESTLDTRRYIARDVAKYYEDNIMNEKCRAYTNLNRYYVFRKKSPSDVTSVKTKKQKGGEVVEKYDFSNPKEFKIPSMDNYNDKYSLINTIHKILVSHRLIPKDVKVDEIIKNLDLEVNQDHEIDNDYIAELAEKVIINHVIVDDKDREKTENVLDGLNILIVERDCNNFYDTQYTKPKNASSDTRAVVIVKEGTLYKPIMRIEQNGGMRGLFKNTDPMIIHLMDNGTAF